MRGHDRAAAFVDASTGSHRFVVDYLVEEVLGRRPREVREFLLATCVLDGLTGALCDAVTGRTDGQRMLDRYPAGRGTLVTTYEVRVAGHLDDHWSARLGGLSLVRHDDGTTVLTGRIVDQAQLHGVLAAIRDLGAPLLSLHAITAPPR